MLNFEELWKRLNVGDESVSIEAKTASDLGPSIWETVSAFSNEPGRGGGYLLLGVSRVDLALFPTYDVVGLADPDKIQADMATQCRGIFSTAVRPIIEVASHGDKAVVVVFVPEAPPSDKPIYVQSRGLNRGAYRRIGSTDQLCTDGDLQLFFQLRSHTSFDEGVVTDCTLTDVDLSALGEYRRIRKEARPDSPELGYSDSDLLHCLNCVSRHEGQLRPTIAGLLLFGTHAAIRRQFPLMRVDYIRVDGKEWVRDPDKRFATIEHLGPLLLGLPRIMTAILDDIPKAFRLFADDNQRTDVPLIPRTAIREAMVNAVMHRCYRQKAPVQIIRYSNRIEIRNPGHSLVPDERLGEPGSTTRNEKIAAVLHETLWAETKGSGIRSMREAMTAANLSPPTFESDRERNQFVVTFLFHHFLSSADVEWLTNFTSVGLNIDEQRALVFAREMGAINNAAYRDINRVETLIASGHLRRLRDLGLLEQRGKSTQTYYVPSEAVLNPSISQGSAPVIRNESQGLTPAIPLAPNSGEDLLRVGEVPAEIIAAAKKLGGAAAPAEVRRVIRQLCLVRAFSAAQIAIVMNRGSDYVRRHYLTPMIMDKELEYTIPDNPSHPNVKYRTVTTLKPEKAQP